MDSGLYEAALTGDVAYLLHLLEKDSLLLDKGSTDGDTPLHVASLHGHLEFVETTLCFRPKLACALDSARHSPLHLASSKGHTEIVKLLLQVEPAMCLVRDQDGMTPLHAAAMKGRVDVVKEIVTANKTTLRVLSNIREPIMHMCVNYNRFNVVKALLESMKDDGELLKMKDDDDNTILHVSVAKKHIPLTKFLLRETIMKEEVNAINVHGSTALDMLLQNRNNSINDIKLEGKLRSCQARKASMMPLPKDSWMVKPSKPEKDGWKEEDVKWLEDIRTALMIVAILIATVAFQSGLHPPGGVWQDDKVDGIDRHVAGQSVLASKYPSIYILFTFFNSLGFISSLMIIMLLISGFPSKCRIWIWALMIITWVSLSSLITTYSLALSTTFTVDVSAFWGSITLVRFTSWIVAVPLLFAAGHIVRIVIKWLRAFCTMTRRGVISIDM